MVAQFKISTFFGHAKIFLDFVMSQKLTICPTVHGQEEFVSRPLHTSRLLQGRPGPGGAKRQILQRRTVKAEWPFCHLT